MAIFSEFPVTSPLSSLVVQEGCGCAHFESGFLCAACDRHAEEHECVFETVFVDSSPSFLCGCLCAHGVCLGGSISFTLGPQERERLRARDIVRPVGDMYKVL